MTQRVLVTAGAGGIGLQIMYEFTDLSTPATYLKKW